MEARERKAFRSLLDAWIGRLWRVAQALWRIEALAAECGCPHCAEIALLAGGARTAVCQVANGHDAQLRLLGDRKRGAEQQTWDLTAQRRMDLRDEDEPTTEPKAA